MSAGSLENIRNVLGALYEDPDSTRCRLKSLGIVKHKERYNFHPCDYEMSMPVRLNIVSRENALKRVEDPDKFSTTMSFGKRSP